MNSLPEAIAAACAPLFSAAPLTETMRLLKGGTPHHAELVEEALCSPALAGRPELAAALWLYVDDLERSHTVSQGIATPTGSYLHGIMHRREGDYSNSRYWFRRAGDHPFIGYRPDLDPEGIVESVELAHGRELPEIVDLQRDEWKAFFIWCARHIQPGK